MGKIRKLVNEMFDSTLTYGYKKRDKLIENIFGIAHELGSFVVKNMDVIKDVFSAADDLIEYNKRYGTDFSLDIHSLLFIEVLDNGDKFIEVISNKDIALRITYKGDIRKIIPRLKINERLYMIDELDYYRKQFQFHDFEELKKISESVSEYMEVFTDVLTDKTTDGNLEDLFVDKIMSFKKQ